jgi:hypothetical protein
MLEFHCTPKNGSWLNIAEIELSVFGRTRKDYFLDENTFSLEVQTLMNERNVSYTKVDWQFRTEDAASN